MRVSALDKNGDWTYGKGKANYITNSRAIYQSVKTRLRSFKNDYFLDVDHGVDWFNLLGRLGNQNAVLRAIERQVLQTEGVQKITEIRLLSNTERRAKIEISYTDIFGEQITIEEPIIL